MMMPKEGMVCSIVFFDTRNIGLVEKSSLYLKYWESYDNFIDFTAILNFSFQKNPLKEWQLYIGPDIIMGCYPCTIKRETNFYQQKQGYSHDYRTTLILQTKIRKKHTLHPSILGVRDRETSFAHEYTRGPRLKG